MIDDGGPAFPVQTGERPSHNESTPDDSVIEGSPGMSLLQYYGGEAMKAILANRDLMKATSKQAESRGVSIHVAVAAIARLQAQVMIDEFCPGEPAGEADTQGKDTDNGEQGLPITD